MGMKSAKCMLFAWFELFFSSFFLKKASLTFWPFRNCIKLKYSKTALYFIKDLTWFLNQLTMTTKPVASEKSTTCLSMLLNSSHFWTNTHSQMACDYEGSIQRCMENLAHSTAKCKGFTPSSSTHMHSSPPKQTFRELVGYSGLSVRLGAGRPGFKAPISHKTYWESLGQSG